MDIKQECVYALEVNGDIVHHFVCSADHLNELSIGYLISKGCMQANEIEKITIDDEQLMIHVLASNYQAGWNQREALLKARDIDVQTCPSCHFDKKVVRDKMYNFHTKGSHTAICITPNGMMIDKDVSRHCAIDKVIGQACHEDFKQCVIVTSGRISCEMVLKAKCLGIPAIATLKYPTTTAKELADRLMVQCIEID